MVTAGDVPAGLALVFERMIEATVLLGICP
jgi:hypothetical protein